MHKLLDSIWECNVNGAFLCLAALLFYCIKKHTYSKTLCLHTYSSLHDMRDNCLLSKGMKVEHSASCSMSEYVDVFEPKIK